MFCIIKQGEKFISFFIHSSPFPSDIDRIILHDLDRQTRIWYGTGSTGKRQLLYPIFRPILHLLYRYFLPHLRGRPHFIFFFIFHLLYYLHTHFPYYIECRRADPSFHAWGRLSCRLPGSVADTKTNPTQVRCGLSHHPPSKQRISDERDCLN